MSILDEQTQEYSQEDQPLTHNEIDSLLGELHTDWIVEADKKINREFTFDDFYGAIGFVNAVADIAEENQHHPNMLITYNKVRITLYTHSVKGLTKNDFIVAAHIDTVAPDDELEAYL